MDQTRKQIQGITLIALVLTIIILLILAGITISLTIGQGGIINMAEKAGTNHLNAQEQEKMEIAKVVNEVEEYINGNRNSIIPNGKFLITENGEYDITQYAKVEVAIPKEELIDSKICYGRNGQGARKNLSFSNLDQGEYNVYICGGRAHDAQQVNSNTNLTNLVNVTFTQNFQSYGDYISKSKMISNGNGSFDVSCFLYNDPYIYFVWITKIQ